MTIEKIVGFFFCMKFELGNNHDNYYNIMVMYVTINNN